MRTGGRLVFACWQDPARSAYLTVPFAAIAPHVTLPELPSANVAGPFSLADPDRIRTIREEAGFHDIAIEGVDAAMNMGDDVEDLVAYYRNTPLARYLLAGANEATIQAIEASLREALLPHHGQDGVMLTGASWLVTAYR